MATIMDREPYKGGKQSWQALMRSQVKAQPGCYVDDPLEDHRLIQVWHGQQ